MARTTVFGMSLINKDARAAAKVLLRATKHRSWFLLAVSMVMALIKVSQELAGLAYTARFGTEGATDAGSGDEDEALDDLADVEVPELDDEEAPASPSGEKRRSGRRVPVQPEAGEDVHF